MPSPEHPLPRAKPIVSTKEPPQSGQPTGPAATQSLTPPPLPSSHRGLFGVAIRHPWWSLLALCGVVLCLTLVVVAIYFAGGPTPTTVEEYWAIVEDPKTCKERQIRGVAGAAYQTFHRTQFHDTYTMAPFGLIYRRVSYYPAGTEILPAWEAEGPMTASNKRHGEWTYHQYGKPDRWLVDARRDRLWFWYGEEISEGDWHLRNRN